MSDKILIVDDEVEIADLIEMYLKSEDYTVYKFYSAKEALACIETTELDLAILDIMMPEIDGLSLCQKIRADHTYPVIMLTALDSEESQIKGIKSQLRRYKKYNPARVDEEEGDILSYLGLVLNTKTYQCTLNGKPLVLTPTEFAILRILLENKGRVISAEELFHRIWHDEYYSKANNTIPVHVRHLRTKLNDTLNKPKYIKTVWGVGYKIEES